MKITINNGHLIDPKNNISEKLNIGIENGKIVELSKNILIGDKMVDEKIKINIFEKIFFLFLKPSFAIIYIKLFILNLNFCIV